MSSCYDKHVVKHRSPEHKQFFSPLGILCDPPLAASKLFQKEIKTIFQTIGTLTNGLRGV
jgi:hypothetical protein